jgi:hypothetical protein
MPDTGAPWNIPYIESSDVVRDYPAADEAQALAIVAALDTRLFGQIIQTVKTDTFSASVATGAFSGDVTGLTASITPTADTSRVLVTCNLTVALSANDRSIYVALYRGGSVVAAATGDVEGSRQRITAGNNGQSTTNDLSYLGFQFLDSPATAAATTYSLRLAHRSSNTETVYVNRTNSDGDANTTGRSASFLQLVEVLP